MRLDGLVAAVEGGDLLAGILCSVRPGFMYLYTPMSSSFQLPAAAFQLPRCCVAGVFLDVLVALCRVFVVATLKCMLMLICRHLRAALSRVYVRQPRYKDSASRPALGLLALSIPKGKEWWWPICPTL